MTNLAEIFSAPFNWCDRRCERCTLSRDCPVWRAESQRRWVHAAHGGDPDDWDVVLEDVAEDMKAALGQLLDIAAAEGIDLEAPLPPAPVVLDAVKLQRAGTALATSVARLGDSVAPAAKRDELVRTATVLGLKATRIASYLSEANPSDAWDADAVPNLLLVELLIRQVRDGLALTPTGEPTRRALEELNRIIEPLLARLDRPRALLGKLVERAAAPSPFCILTVSTLLVH
jgi:hypothetical protein